MSDVSNILRPASRQTSMRRVAPTTSLEPQALKNSLPPPNVAVPRLNTGTMSPDPPSCLISIAMALTVGARQQRPRHVRKPPPQNRHDGRALRVVDSIVHQYASNGITVECPAPPRVLEQMAIVAPPTRRCCCRPALEPAGQLRADVTAAV